MSRMQLVPGACHRCAGTGMDQVIDLPRSCQPCGGTGGARRGIRLYPKAVAWAECPPMKLVEGNVVWPEKPKPLQLPYIVRGKPPRDPAPVVEDQNVPSKLVKSSDGQLWKRPPASQDYAT